MVALRDFKPRLYQETILHTAVKHNTLVVLPTGMGKTAIAMLLAVERLTSYPASKVLFLAPTKPLVAQHLKTFEKHLDLAEEEMALLTGEIAPEKRAKLWRNARIIFSTPQGLSNDIVNGKVSLEEVSCLVIDEAHRCVGDYDYVWICKQYHQKARYPRILGMTASPGANTENILAVCKNAYIDEIEVRVSDDPDVKPYVREIEIEYINVELPDEMKEIKKFLTDSFKQKLEKLKEYGYLTNKARPSRKELLDIQGDLHRRIAMGEKDFSIWSAVSVNAEAIKVQHAVDLLETQGIGALSIYLEKLFEAAEKTKTKATKNLVKDINFKSAYVKAKHLNEEAIEHPKIGILKSIVKDEIAKKADSKIIIFNQYRDSALKLVNELNQLPDVQARLFVGQMKKGETGLKQKEQIAMLDEFRTGLFNCLVSSSVGEEGLDIPAVDLVVFYEPVPSAIRKIQRVGRTGRIKKGRVKILVTKNTVDEAYRWTAHHKERQMYSAIYELKNSLHLKRSHQPSIASYESASEIKIFADTREQGSGIIKALVDMGANVKMQKLLTADFIVSGEVGVERKEVSDFVSSLIDKRILQQIKDLKANFAKPLLIIEGTDDIYSVRKVHPNAIRGMLAAIALSFRVPILYTKNVQDTAEMIMAIAKREQLETGSDFMIRTDKKPLTTREQQEFIVESLPNIGVQAARALLAHFGSVKGIANASFEELQKVENIGEKKAEEIRRILDEKYSAE